MKLCGRMFLQTQNIGLRLPLGVIIGMVLTMFLYSAGSFNQLLSTRSVNSSLNRFNFGRTAVTSVDNSEAKRLAKEVRVLIWVMTNPKNHQSKAASVRDTWGPRANKLLFFSSKTDKSIPTIGLNVSEGREHLTQKSQHAWRYIYENHFNDADWFMKADDNTYVIVENLRYFLSGENPQEPVHFGHLFKLTPAKRDRYGIHVKQGYYSGGSGYVLSKEALRRWGEKGMEGVAKLCAQDGSGEDLHMGICMEKLGVRVANSTDIHGRSRFHCLNMEGHVFGYFPPWYYDFRANNVRKGEDSMSDYTISFHYVAPKEMRILDFLIYRVVPYGIAGRDHQNLNRLNSTVQ